MKTKQTSAGRSDGTSNARASAEDADLWLDKGLFLDVRHGSGAWLVAEVVEVNRKQRLIRIAYQSDAPEEWIAVDRETERLANLGTKSVVISPQELYEKQVFFYIFIYLFF